MLSLSRLLCGTVTSGDALRYGRRSSGGPAHLLHFSEDKRPVVVWNVTRRCNLKCVHCYAASEDRAYRGELTTEEALRVIDDLADFGVPVVLFSGGEPLLREDLFELSARVVERGMRAVLSTNGTLIDEATIARVKEQGFSYVGVSLDGTEGTHDRFRGVEGAFGRSLTAIRTARDAGVRVGVRYTITRHNQHDLPALLDLLEREDIPRFCMYHLAQSGRGRRMAPEMLAPHEIRAALDLLFDRVLDWHARGIEKEVLTVDNHADAAYLYMRVLRDQPERAEDVLRLLRWNGGNQSGLAIACIDNTGRVHPDQFSWNHTVGNVRERPFGEIWSGEHAAGLLHDMRNRAAFLSQRCTSCRFFELCNGNLRSRAEAATGDFWGDDPACYLTDDEIAVPA
jgi:radical SAM protein with 4Fe4S-binding SPASM domain